MFGVTKASLRIVSLFRQADAEELMFLATWRSGMARASVASDVVGRAERLDLLNHQALEAGLKNCCSVISEKPRLEREL